jgi:hypothetical protein
MELLWKHLDALVHLLFGGAIAIWAVYACVRARSILGMVLYLSFGAAFMALGLLDLLGLLDPEGVGVSRNAVVGIGLIWTSVSALYSPPEPRFPRWTQWAFLVYGIGSLSWAIVCVLHYDWR